jgi:hypothetical protein
MTALILMEAPLRRDIIQATMMHVYSVIRFSEITLTLLLRIMSSLATSPQLMMRLVLCKTPQEQALWKQSSIRTTCRQWWDKTISLFLRLRHRYARLT